MRELFGDDTGDVPWLLRADDDAPWLPPASPGGFSLEAAGLELRGDDGAAWRCLDASHAADCAR